MLYNNYMPGLPTTPEPEELVALASSLHHADVSQVGLTTTACGDWALLVVVKKGIEVPIQEIEEKSQGYPVVYQQDPDGWQYAGPALLDPQGED